MARSTAALASVLDLLRSPPAGSDRASVVRQLLQQRCFHVVQRGLEEGVIGPAMEVGGGVSLLHSASACGGVGLLRSLVLDRGMDPNSLNHGMDPLHVAIGTKQHASALFFINDAPGADVNSNNHVSVLLLRPLMLAAQQAGLHPHFLDGKGLTPLMLAAMHGMVELMAALVAKGANVNWTVPDSYASALGWAIFFKQEEAAVYLVSQARAALRMGISAAVGPADRQLGTWSLEEMAQLLGYVESSGHLRLLKAILRRMRAEGTDGAVMAHYMGVLAKNAIVSSRLPSLAVLEEEGLDVKAVEVTVGHTIRATQGLLHVAAAYGNQGAAAWLIERGCDPWQLDSAGLLPHHRAALHGQLSFLLWFRGLCPIIAEEMAAEPTALAVAAMSGNLGLVEWLVGLGADPRRSDSTLNGRRPSQLATGSQAVAAYLRAREDTAQAAAVGATGRKRRREEGKAKAGRGAGAAAAADSGCWERVARLQQQVHALQGQLQQAQAQVNGLEGGTGTESVDGCFTD
jgi:ankyrin repeat protein